MLWFLLKIYIEFCLFAGIFNALGVIFTRKIIFQKWGNVVNLSDVIAMFIASFIPLLNILLISGIVILIMEKE